MIKLVLGSKNKIIKHQKRNFKELRELIRTCFPQAPLDFSLSYLDQDKDQICLNSDSDLNNMLNSKVKVYKVYVKQSLSQTIVIDVERSDYIQPSFENSSLEENRKEEPVPEVGFLKQALKEPTGVIIQLKPVQKINTESLPEAQEKLPQEQKKEKEMERIQIAEKPQVKQDNFSKSIEIPKQKLEIVEVAKEKPKQPSENKPLNLDVTAQKRVVSKVQQVKKEEEKPSIEKMYAQVSRAKIFLKEEEEIKKYQKKQQDLQFHGVICSSCKDEFGILGIRYQCILCSHFNLCSNCQAQNQHQHALLKVKTPKQTITDALIIEKFRKEIYMPPEEKVIPAGNFIPSIQKEDALRILETAKQASENGLNRTKNLIEELFFKMEMSHNNPYDVVKPIPVKNQPPGLKAQYLSQMVGISKKQALKFVHSCASSLDQQKILELYLAQNK